MAETFTLPDFLLEAEPERIQARMMEELPDDIDDMPAGFPWDFTMPSAIVISEFVENRLARALQVMFPQYAWGEWLDYHGERINLPRRAARKATGTLHLVGNIGLEIPAGTIFCTPATDFSESILFETDEAVTITTGAADVPITAVEEGSGSNVMAGAISLAFRAISELSEISNTEIISDGADEEDDETYRERILENYRAELLFVGNPADYVRWAKEISGVGTAVCISEWNGPGTVQVVVSDTSGNPASTSILDEVYEHIMANTENSLSRLAPVGATLTVVAPTQVDITYTVQIKVDSSYAADDVRAMILKNLEDYYEEAINDGELKWADCFAIITQTEGVYDAKNLTLNGGTSNIQISRTQFPKTVSFTATTY